MKEMAEIAKEGFLLKQQLIQEAKSGLEEKKVRMERKWLVFMKSQDPEYWHMEYCSAKYVLMQIHQHLVSAPTIVYRAAVCY